MYYDKFKNDIKFFYVEYKEDLENDISEIGNYIYIKGDDCPLIPNFLTKMVKAFKYIDDNYNYDYMIHTNLSSVWNIPVLLSLYNEIPRNDFFGGYLCCYSFVTGTGIFFSKDLIPLLLNIDTRVNENEDVAISFFMKNKGKSMFDLEKLSKYRMEYIISDQPYTNENYDSILYFRIKNQSHELDIQISKQIVSKLYGINLPQY
jgi:hypothetical protein